MKIYENRTEHLSDFIRLNEEWITAYFEIEAIDRELAVNPKKIIDDGGYVFSLLLKNRVVGVCALFNDGNGVYELARMAVASEHRGNGYANKLLDTCLSKLVNIAAREVYLVSNTKLKQAISLYEKYGFKITSQSQHPVYARANIMMVRILSKD